jgi:predicted phosphodiesterase
MGKKHRKKIGSKSLFSKPEDRHTTFDQLPKSRKNPDDWAPHKIKAERLLVLADVHVPFHHRDALKMALEYGHDRDVDHIIFLGDFMDFYSISSFVKDPEERDFQDELHTGIMVLETIRSNFPDIKMTFIRGNHEDRYERYMRLRAPDLIGVECFSLQKLLSLEHFKIDLVDEGSYIELGKLSCVHGHEFGGSASSPVNAARGLFLRGLECCMCGHWHRTSQHTEPTMKGRVVATYGVGCLCDLHPEYRPNNKWNLGFAFITLEDEDFEVNNLRIQKVDRKLKIRR